MFLANTLSPSGDFYFVLFHRSDIESFLLSRFEEFLYDEDLFITDDTQIDIEFEFEENT